MIIFWYYESSGNTMWFNNSYSEHFWIHYHLSITNFMKKQVNPIFFDTIILIAELTMQP